MYTVEITDTFGGEANYSWRQEYKVVAEDAHLAMTEIAKDFGGRWLKAWGDDESSRWDLNGACICAFITWVDE